MPLNTMITADAASGSIAFHGPARLIGISSLDWQRLQRVRARHHDGPTGCHPPSCTNCWAATLVSRNIAHRRDAWWRCIELICVSVDYLNGNTIVRQHEPASDSERAAHLYLLHAWR